VEESQLQADAPEAVAKKAGSAQKSSWKPSWNQARDLEFCLEMKAVDGKPKFELHSRKSISETPVCPLGMTLHSTRSPSEQLFGASGKGNASLPGLANASSGWSGAPPPVQPADFEAFQQQMQGKQYSMYPGFQQGFAGMPQAGNFNQGAAVFMPGLLTQMQAGEKSWDGIYQ
jgi:hypothetical protein